MASLADYEFALNRVTEHVKRGDTFEDFEKEMSEHPTYFDSLGLHPLVWWRFATYVRDQCEETRTITMEEARLVQETIARGESNKTEDTSKERKIVRIIVNSTPGIALARTKYEGNNLRFSIEGDWAYITDLETGDISAIKKEYIISYTLIREENIIMKEVTKTFNEWDWPFICRDAIFNSNIYTTMREMATKYGDLKLAGCIIDDKNDGDLDILEKWLHECVNEDVAAVMIDYHHAQDNKEKVKSIRNMARRILKENGYYNTHSYSFRCSYAKEGILERGRYEDA